MSRAANAYYFPASFLVGFGVYESISVIGMLADVVDKWKSPIYQLSVLAILAQVIGQFLVCIGLDFVISPFAAPQSFLGLASLGVSLCNQITMICVNIAALMLIYTFFKTQKLIFAGWCVIGGLCILLRIAAFILAFGAFLPFVNGTYQGLNFAVNPAFVPYSLTVSVDAIVESVFICMTSVVFIRHIIQKLELPPWEVAREIVLKYGGLKFLMLIGIRFFGAGLIFKLMASGFVADNISNMANYTSTIHQSWAIFIILQTAFFVTKSLMERGKGTRMRDSATRKSVSESPSKSQFKENK